MDNLWKIAKKRGRIVPSYCGSVGPVCCGPSLGLLGLHRGGEGEALDEWCPPEADVFMSYPRGGHGKYMIIWSMLSRVLISFVIQVDTCTQPDYWHTIESFINKITSHTAPRIR